MLYIFAQTNCAYYRVTKCTSSFIQVYCSTVDAAHGTLFYVSIIVPCEHNTVLEIKV